MSSWTLFANPKPEPAKPWFVHLASVTDEAGVSGEWQSLQKHAGNEDLTPQHWRLGAPERSRVMTRIGKNPAAAPTSFP